MNAVKQPNLSEYASKLIRHKAQQLVGRYGITRSDREDIEQELALHLIERLPSYDAMRGSANTFANRLVNRKVASIIRHRRAHKRDHCRVTSIDAAVCHKFAGTVSAPDSEARHDLAIDLAAVIEKLDSDAQHFCRMLMSESIAETARRLALTRSQARTCIAQIGKLFTEAGVGIYRRDATAKSPSESVGDE